MFSTITFLADITRSLPRSIFSQMQKASTGAFWHKSLPILISIEKTSGHQQRGNALELLPWTARNVMVENTSDAFRKL